MLQKSTLPLSEECVIVLQPTEATPYICTTSCYVVDVWLLLPTNYCTTLIKSASVLLLALPTLPTLHLQ